MTIFSSTYRPLRLIVAGGALVGALGLAGCGGNSMSGMDHGSSSSPTASSSGSSSAKPASGPHNDADVMFAQMMIPHHQQAVEMSDIILAKSGINSDVTKLAQQIKGAQAPEITEMTGWLQGWGASTAMPMDHGMGDGMMSQADMDALKNASGNDAARAYLTGMTKHHEGAISMAKTELSNGQNPDAKKLAQSIVTSQQAEITKMGELLKTI